MNPLQQEIVVRSAQGDYLVRFTPTVEAAVAALLETPPSAVVVDRRVAVLHAASLAPLLGALPVLEVDATEETKTLQGVETCVRFFQAAGLNRRSTVLAVGGGIVQDLVTFSAHMYYRGIGWRFLPTTLLSMSDSCIGAKCGINLGAFKNQLGVFQSPREVVITDAFLRTLDDREVASGYGEILKLMLTGSPAHFDRLEAILDAHGLRHDQLLGLIRDSLEVKREVIEADEYESGLRQILNYGHTFGHALEAATDHAVPHGQAVAWGIDVVNAIAVSRGLFEAGTRDRIRRLIQRHLPLPRVALPSAQALIEGVKRDKKAASGSVTLAVLREPGRLDRVPTPIDEALTADLQRILDAGARG